MLINKITIGFVIQRYDDHTGNCIGQEFIAGDQVDYETLSGEPITPLDFTEIEQYQPFDMVQPA